MADIKTERTEEEKEEAKKRKLANLKPFRKYEELTEEEKERQRQVVTKGGYARVNQVAKQKTLKEQALLLLASKVSREEAEMVVGESAKNIADDDLTMQALLVMSAFREATVNGNVKAMEFLRDTSGQRPKDVIDTNLNVMSDADKQLLEKVSKRLNAV